MSFVAFLGGSLLANWLADPNNPGISEFAEYDPHGRLEVFDAAEQQTCKEAGSAQTVCENPNGAPFGFVGALRSRHTGLVYMRNRWYSPRLTQFLSPDPLGYVDSFNPYAYVAFDPINGWDPWGLQASSLADYMNVTLRVATDHIAENLQTTRWLVAGVLGGVLGIPGTAEPPDKHATAYHVGALGGATAGLVADAVGIVGGAGMMGGGTAVSAGTLGLGSPFGVPAAVAGGAVVAGSAAMAGIHANTWSNSAGELIHQMSDDGATSAGTPGQSRATESSIYTHIPDTGRKANQVSQRGWTRKSVHDTVNNPFTTRSATNKATGGEATAFYTKDGAYVVRDNKTGELLQVSNRNDTKWTPDSSIIDPYFP